jgi:hypothetical protein
MAILGKSLAERLEMETCWGSAIAAFFTSVIVGLCVIAICSAFCGCEEDGMCRHQASVLWYAIGAAATGAMCGWIVRRRRAKNL